MPEWGVMLSSGRDYLGTSSHVVIMPGIAIFLTVLAFNLIGDGLRDVLDPKIKIIKENAYARTCIASK